MLILHHTEANERFVLLSIVPQKGANNVYNTNSKRKSLISYQFFFDILDLFFKGVLWCWYCQKIFLSFSKVSKTNYKNDFSRTIQRLKGVKSRILVGPALILWNWHPVFNCQGHNGPALVKIGLIFGNLYKAMIIKDLRVHCSKFDVQDV